MDDHLPLRDKVAALEKALHDALEQAGYHVLNEVKCRQRLDPQLWQEVVAAFSPQFTKLKPPTASAAAGREQL